MIVCLLFMLNPTDKEAEAFVCIRDPLQRILVITCLPFGIK